MWCSLHILNITNLFHSANSVILRVTESGRLEFDEFVTLAAKFIVEEDDETMQKELKEAFRLYDKEGKVSITWAQYWMDWIV